MYWVEWGGMSSRTRSGTRHLKRERRQPRRKVEVSGSNFEPMKAGGERRSLTTHMAKATRNGNAIVDYLLIHMFGVLFSVT